MMTKQLPKDHKPMKAAGESSTCSTGVGQSGKRMDEMNTNTKVNESPSKTNPSTGLTVLFLSSDTGGGHRASAESLAKQFELQYPGTTYHLLDVMSDHGVPPYSNLVDSYKHLSAHPKQWKAIYSLSNTRAFEMLADVHLRLMCERAIRKRIKSFQPDVVVSVHPLMTNVPIVSCRKISQETGRHLPMFTVVTDLGSGHCLWFANGVEKMFIASEQIRHLAKARGKVPDDKLVRVGLPIRHDFAVQAEALGDRASEKGKTYRTKVRKDLGLNPEKKTVLVMGGGEGVGSLSNIVNALYVEFMCNGIDATIVVVCGRNEKLKKDLLVRDWSAVMKRHFEESNNASASCWIQNNVVGGGCLEAGVITTQLRRILSSSSLTMERAITAPLPDSDTESDLSSIDDTDEEEYENAPKSLADDLDLDEPQNSRASIDATMDINSFENSPGEVEVVPLGFITRMAEYMVAADVLVSKAGPGTIAEAASVGLPVMLTSFLPGQEEGNVDFVVDGKFGAYCSDSDPSGIAEEVAKWLMKEKKLRRLSKAAKAKGAPNAAADIVRHIGESTLEWKKKNDSKSPSAVITSPGSECSSVSSNSSE